MAEKIFEEFFEKNTLPEERKAKLNEIENSLSVFYGIYDFTVSTIGINLDNKIVITVKCSEWFVEPEQHNDFVKLHNLCDINISTNPSDNRRIVIDFTIKED